MQGVILAAGKGSRLHPITLQRSKAMLPILGKPIVERVMEMLADNGVDDFILVVSPQDRDITRYFRRESTIEADIRFVYQPERKGMANALACAAPLIGETFVLSACDNLVATGDVARLIAMMQGASQPHGVLTLMKVEPERLGSVGIVEMDGPWVTRIVEKPRPEEAPSDISSLLTNAADLLALNREYLTHGDGRPQLAPTTVGPNTRLITPLHIGVGTTIGCDCVIGPNVYIERNCRIGDGVTIRDAVLLRGSEVLAGTTVINQVVA